jgi:hypothetical protein
LDDHHAPAGEPIAGQETSLQVILNFLRWLFTNKDAQDGVDRVMRSVMKPLILVVVTLGLLIGALYAAPAPVPVKVISAGGVTAIGIITSVMRQHGKRRNGPLAAARSATRPARPIAAA